jgi:hypothetical protein
LTAVTVNVYKPGTRTLTDSVVAVDEKVVGVWAAPPRYGVTM